MTKFITRFSTLGRLLLLGVATACLALPAAAQDSAGLKARTAAMKDKFADNPFGRPLVLESTQTDGDLRGDVYAIVDHPFSTVQQSLRSIDHWCDILILHLNVKRCRAQGDSIIALDVGRKFDQPLENAYQLSFAFKVAATAPDYLHLQLSAEQGPLSTKNYRIRVEATSLDSKRSLVHMSYAYGYGFSARMAIQGYLATLGRDKVGFSIVDRGADGKPVHVGGVLGLLERNTMRYYLAIDAYLGAPEPEQSERRLQAWHASTERYAAQLREMDRDQYLEMKRKEIKRQQAG